MKLDSIQISQFRNLTNVELLPSLSLNLVYGDNGSGKSSILEAIHFLGYGRSFRTSKPKHIIQTTKPDFSVFAKCSITCPDRNEKKLKRLGISRNIKDELICSVDGERSSRMADLVSILPVQIFTPQSIDLMIGSPSARRKFLDWGLFHVEHSYGDLSRSYRRLLKQRNALLKKLLRSSKSFAVQSADTKSQIDYWDTQLSILGEQINDRRLSYVKQLNKEFSEVIRHFLPEFSFQISYYSGWDIALSLKSHLESKFGQDLKLGSTSSGVHKADLRIKTDGGVAAFEVLSRGQLRMLVAALQLAQTKILNLQGDNSGVFLLDDIGAELDDKHRQVFISSLMKTDTQVFITAIEKGQFSLSAETYNKKMFHVKHGHVIEEQ